MATLAAVWETNASQSEQATMPTGGKFFSTFFYNPIVWIRIIFKYLAEISGIFWVNRFFNFLVWEARLAGYLNCYQPQTEKGPDMEFNYSSIPFMFQIFHLLLIGFFLKFCNEIF